MNNHHASKSMNALIRLRQQQQYQTERDEDEAHDKDLHQHQHLHLHHNLKDEDNGYNYNYNYDDATTILKKNNIKTNVTNTYDGGDDHDHYYDTMMNTSSMNNMDNDLYTPLSPEEANEDQLAEFFIGLDVSFLQQQQPEEGVREEEEEQTMNTSMATTQEVPGVVVCHATKRRRLFLSFEDADSSSLSSLCSSSYSIDTDSDDDDDDDDTDFVLHRKNRNLLQRE